MMTTLVTLIQNAERAAAATDCRPAGRFVRHERALPAVARRLMQRWARRGFRSGTRMSSVSVPGVDFWPGRSSSV
jgi:hypothetical protein